MRKTLAAVCYILMLAADAAAGYFTYRAFVQKISYDQGVLTFVPLFIVSYWFSTFFRQLIHPRGSKPIIGRGLYNFLYWLSTLLSLALLGTWVYLFIDRSLYLNFGTEVSGELRY